MAEEYNKVLYVARGYLGHVQPRFSRGSVEVQVGFGMLYSTLTEETQQ